MSKVNLGLIGCGGISDAHVRGYEELNNVNIVALSSAHSQSKAKKHADWINSFQKKKPEIYTDFREMLDIHTEIDAVDVCTYHADHHEIAEFCLEAGKHVLMEKPFGITVKACKKMIDTADKCGKIIATSEEFRRSASARAVNWAIRKGYLGKPRMLLWIDTEERLIQWGWRDKKLKAGGGWILDGGVHYADMFRYHLGEAKTIFAKTMKYEPFRYNKFGTLPLDSTDASSETHRELFMHKFDWPPGPDRVEPIEVDVEDTVTATIEFEEQVLVQWFYSCAAPGKILNQRILYGSEGYIDLVNGVMVCKQKAINIEELVEEFLKTLSEEEKRTLFPAGEKNPKGNAIGDFCDAILNNSEPELDGVEALKDVAIPIAVYESAWLCQPVNVKDVEESKLENYQREINNALNIS